MKFRTYIEFFLSILLFSSLCLSDDAAFISMTGDCKYPAIASEGNSIYMAWLYKEGRFANIWFRHSPDEGKEWTGARQISNENGDCYPPAIAVNAGTVHMAWIDFGETINGEIYYNRSIDGGATWQKNFILVKDANSSRYPLIACKENNVYLIWQDVENKVYFKASHNKGLAWENEVLLGKVGKHGCYCYPPAISFSENKLIVVWTDFREDKSGFAIGLNGFSVFKKNDKMASSIVCRTSSDNGGSWSKELVLTTARLSKETKDEIDNPILLANGYLSYLFWLDRRNVPLGEICYARFNPKTQKGPITGKLLHPPEKRSPKRPSVVFDKEGNIHFTWARFLGRESIISYSQVDSSGNVLKEMQDLTTQVGRYNNPIMTRTQSGLLLIFWFDEPKDIDDWSRIFLKTSKDNGLTWEDWGPPKKEM